MQRLMGIDYGDARIGIAISDPLGYIATPLEIISRKNPTDLSLSIKRISEILDEYSIKTIILGFPKHMNNNEGENCKKVSAFEKLLLKKISNITILLEDERLSTSSAHKIINFNNTKNTGIDKFAAAIILQNFLDRENNKKKTNTKLILRRKKMNENEILENDGEEELETIVLTDDDGNEKEYFMIDEFVHNGTQYFVMVDAENADNEESEGIILKQVESNSEDEVAYEELNEQEYETIVEVLKSRLEEFDIEY